MGKTDTLKVLEGYFGHILAYNNVIHFCPTGFLSSLNFLFWSCPWCLCKKKITFFTPHFRYILYILILMLAGVIFSVLASGILVESDINISGSLLEEKKKPV